MNAADRWTEPGTAQTYPFAFEAYRRQREAEEKPLPRHQFLGGQVDQQLWRRWRVRPDRHVDVLLTLRQGASPRIRRIVAAVLASIRRGHPPETAIRLAAKRFGLPSGRVRACLADHVGFHLEREDVLPWAFGDVTSVCLIHDWI